jgi:hypothetical protein
MWSANKMIVTRVLQSKKTLIALVAIAFLDLQKPGYMTFANPHDLFPKECKVAQTFTVPNLPWLQTGLSKSSTMEQWKRKLGRPTCYQGDTPLWLIPGAFYLKLDVNKNGAVTSYSFYR